MIYNNQINRAYQSMWATFSIFQPSTQMLACSSLITVKTIILQMIFLVIWCEVYHMLRFLYCLLLSCSFILVESLRQTYSKKEKKNLGHDLRQARTTFQSIILFKVNFLVGEKKLYCTLHNTTSFPPSLLFLVVQTCHLLLNTQMIHLDRNIRKNIF